MSYPPQGSTGQSASGHSTPTPGNLPARPPPPASGHGYGGFKPRSVASAPQRTSASPAPSQYSQPYSSYDMSAGAYSTASVAQTYYPTAPGAQGYNAPPAYGGQQAYGQQAFGAQATGYPAGYDQQTQYEPTPPQIRNPFAPPPAAGASGAAYGVEYDPEHQAQLQQWQSQYQYAAGGDGKGLGKSGYGEGAKSAGGANTVPLAHNRLSGQANAPHAAAPVEAGKEKTVVRQGGGQSWEDPTLLEWGNHHRIFVGNLAGEVTDESLLKAFAKYPSVQKARVVREKRTTKSKGFGFVSFADADDYFQAAREMNGKYIGSHPVLIRRAETQINASDKKDKDKGKYKGKGGDKGGKKDNSGVLGANSGAGVKKAKVDSKYKVLG